MRRLRKQSRDDTYRSNRDYQTIHDRRGRRFVPARRGTCRVVFTTQVSAGQGDSICWGGYALVETPTTLRATLTVGDCRRLPDSA